MSSVSAVAESVTVGATKMPASAARTHPTTQAERALRTLLAPFSVVNVRSSTDARIVTPSRVR